MIIAVFDISSDLNEEDFEIMDIIKNKNAIILLNKNDVVEKNKEMEKEIEKISKPIFKISAKNNIGIDKLYSKIDKIFNLGKIEANNEIVVTNERHKNLINKANENICEAIKSIQNKIPIDMVSVYIKESLECLGEIMGENISDEIINQIFKNFCLGK